MVTPLQARGLALNRDLKNLSGERYLLLGDAAMLVDPFTGEGVGQAMASAESAAAVISNCFETNNFSASAMLDYDTRIRRRMGMEHRTSRVLQKYARNRIVFDGVVKSCWFQSNLK